MTARFVKRGVDRIALILILAVVPTIVPAHHVDASAENKTRLVFEIKVPLMTVPTIHQLAELTQNEQTENAPVMITTDEINAQILREYLASKNSMLAEQAELLLNQPDWKLIVAISHAESNMCKRQLGFNCWGIGGGNHRKYPDLATAIIDAQTVIGKYVARGADTPAEMLRTYVGWNNQNWVLACNQILNQLNALPLEG